MYVIAITGNAASGKSAAVERLRQLGIKSISADQINASLLKHSRFLVSNIEKTLGKSFTNPDGSLNIADLRQAAFSSALSRMELERLLHPVIMSNIDLQLSLLPENDYCLVEIPLLFEAGLQQEFDRTLLITASQQNLVARLSARPEITRQVANTILDHQMADIEKFQYASDIVLNNEAKSDLFHHLDALHTLLTENRDARG